MAPRNLRARCSAGRFPAQLGLLGGPSAAQATGAELIRDVSRLDQVWALLLPYLYTLLELHRSADCLASLAQTQVALCRTLWPLVRRTVDWYCESLADAASNYHGG